ncbi:MAG: hypothetical protein GY759_19165 [Chloroflexi bacterium]|nr:hypothetical protein [Chloroflexota bacterium]
MNEDGNTPDKRKLVESLGIEYVVLQRTPHDGFLPRSTTDLRKIDQLPYRIDLAGGWLDQSFCLQTSSWFSHHPLHRTHARIQRAQRGAYRQGAWATSTRRTAMILWGNRLPVEDPHKLAYILFCCDNPSGTEDISGVQDNIGLVFPGLERSKRLRMVFASRRGVHHEQLRSQ